MDKDKDMVKDKEKTFKPPTVEEVSEYCIERNNQVDPESFIDFYESKGWMVGKNKMKDWKSSLRRAEKWDSIKDKKVTAGRGYQEYKHFDEIEHEL